MGKKRSRKAKSSKGLRQAIAKENLAIQTPADKLLNKVDAWKRGDNPWLSVASDAESNKPFKRIRANQHWGDPRRRFNIYGKVKEQQ